ncbi:hypothetical protein DM01DRAFT_1407949 [Hesseltinella vesiculosa]|uniref:Uncharacterized protein n=1 Tax=Hesseltinella vesiculosa TaxID=101127 RepID=A0A1X2GGL6_9FUNG|nr:hypothetical protein DM01DRAFT_1407949 [Hesseltinella vesiculosa]
MKQGARDEFNASVNQHREDQRPMTSIPNVHGSRQRSLTKLAKQKPPTLARTTLVKPPVSDDQGTLVPSFLTTQLRQPQPSLAAAIITQIFVTSTFQLLLGKLTIKTTLTADFRARLETSFQQCQVMGCFHTTWTSMLMIWQLAIRPPLAPAATTADELQTRRGPSMTPRPPIRSVIRNQPQPWPICVNFSGKHSSQHRDCHRCNQRMTLSQPALGSSPSISATCCHHPNIAPTNTTSFVCDQ